jgi:hypothetical protein
MEITASWPISFTLRKKSQYLSGKVRLRAGLDAVPKEKSIFLPGIKP